MPFEEFIEEFKDMHAVVHIEPDNEDFAQLCDMIEAEGLVSWDGNTVLGQAKEYYQDYPYLGRTGIDCNEISCWRNPEGKRVFYAAEIIRPILDEEIVDEAAALLNI